MKKFVQQLLFGRNTTLSGLIALAIVATIALGCNCTKDLDLSSNSGGNTSSDNPFGSSNQGASNTSTSRPGESRPDAKKGTLPSDGELQFLVRETMLSFNNAIETADFDEFHSSISKQWKKQITPEGMKSSFQKFIDGKASFGEIRNMTATISSKGTRKQSGFNVLDVKGEYATSGVPTTFDLSYIAEGSDWKLFKIEVYTGVRSR